MNAAFRQLDHLVKESYLHETNELVHYLEHLTRKSENGTENLFLEHNIISVQNGVEIYSLDPELLQEFKLRFKVPKIKFDKVKEKFMTSMTKLEKWLEDKGIPISEIKKLVKTAVSKIMRILKRIKTKKQAKQASKELQTVFVNSVKNLRDASFLEAVAESLATIVVVIFVNSIVAGLVIAILSLMVGPVIAPKLGMAITAIIVAPFTEEVAKNLALRNNYPWLYVTFFAWAELLMYVSAGVPFVIRLLPLAMHYATVWFQKYMYEKGLESGKSEDESASTGLKLGIVIHSLWNTMAVLTSMK